MWVLEDLLKDLSLLERSILETCHGASCTKGILVIKSICILAQTGRTLDTFFPLAKAVEFAICNTLSLFVCMTGIA